MGEEFQLGLVSQELLLHEARSLHASAFHFWGTGVG